MKLVFIIWTIFLIIEVIWFSNLRVSPHSLADLLFIMTIIMITLIVGGTGLLVLSKKEG